MSKKHCHPGTCFDGSPLCKLEETREDYRRLWCEGTSNDKPRLIAEAPVVNSNGPSPPRTIRPTPKAVCVHLGEPTGEVIQCPTCGDPGRRLKLMLCEVHGKCLPGKVTPGIQCCLNCKDYEAGRSE